MSKNFVSPNTLNISVPIVISGGNTLASYIFPTQQELFNRKIIAIETFCAVDMLYDPLNPLNTPLDPPTFNAAFLTLYTSAIPDTARKSGTQEPGLFYDKIPFSALRRVKNDFTGLNPMPSGTDGVLFRIRPTELAFNKCKIEFPRGIAAAANQSAVFTFHYLDVGDDGAKYNM